MQLNNQSASKENFATAFLKSMWNQTVPLFHKQYIRVTLIVCNMQFWLYVVTNGMYMWFPHIINSMVEFMNAHPGEHKEICQIVYDKHESLYKSDGVSTNIWNWKQNWFTFADQSYAKLIVELENYYYFFILVMRFTKKGRS